MNINYTSHGFPIPSPTYLTGSNTLDFSPAELFWAAITVGRASMVDVTAHGIFSRHEVLYRTFILKANLALDLTGAVLRSPAYQNLDPSEKGAISYFLGLAFTKLLAAKRLKTPFLLHIDVYRHKLSRAGYPIIYGTGKISPDLVGLDITGKWVIMESKGRSGAMQKGLLAKAKKQTENVSAVGSAPIHWRVAVVTHFKNNDKLTVDWEDPEGQNPDSFDIDTTESEYLTHYYQLVFNLLKNNETRKVNDFLVYTFNEIELTIGLRQSIFHALESSDVDSIHSIKISRNRISDFLETERIRIENQEVYVGRDGVLIAVGPDWVSSLKKAASL